MCTFESGGARGHRTIVYGKLVADPEGLVGFYMKKPQSNLPSQLEGIILLKVLN